MNKKALVLKTLVTIILSLIIFIPLFLFISRTCELSRQAQENFYDFVKEIKDLGENGRDKEIRNFILIMDKNTLIINLWSDDLNDAIRCPKDGDEEHLINAGGSCNENDCLCLIREVKQIEDSGETGTVCNGEERDIVKYTPTAIECVEFSESFYVYGLDWQEWIRFEDRDRRFSLGLEKRGNIIFVCKEPPCEIPAQPEPHPKK